MRIFYTLMFPFIWLLNGTSSLVLRLLRLPPASEAEMLHSPDELRLVIQHVPLDPGARRLIDRVFDYTHRVARHVMMLRRDVVTLTAGVPFDDNLRIALANQYTRYPLVEPGTDRVVGYIHLKDIVSALASGKRPAFMRELVREPIYASEDTRLEFLRREFQRRRVHIAIILGPGHTFVGIVTLEDLLEEVMGEIQDEQDTEEIPPIVRSSDGSIDIDGRLTLDVATRELGMTFPTVPPEVETLGGFLITQLPELPVPGDVITAAGFRFTVLAVRDRRIRRLHAVAVSPRQSRSRKADGRNPRRRSVIEGQMETEPLRIDLFADVVCPWCFVGHERLERVLASTGRAARITHHPFMLDPNTPPEGDDIPARLRRKYGVPPEQLWARLEAEARKSGLELDLAKQRLSYPTARAHTLIRHAEGKGEGRQDALVRDLYRANFMRRAQHPRPRTCWSTSRRRTASRPTRCCGW